MENAATVPPASRVRRLPGGRGRPRSNPYDQSDLGTPELIYKRLCESTKEPLDLYLERCVITPDQHWCGVHLRWLYTLRYGLPGVCAIDTTHLGGREAKTEDGNWRAAREKEYLEAITLLKRARLANIVLSVCVHNEPLTFHSYSTFAGQQREHFIRGLELLRAYWRR